MKRIEMMKKMSIEQFAGEIYANFDADIYCKNKPQCDKYDAKPEDCINCIVDWLDQEIKAPAEPQLKRTPEQNTEVV